MLSPFIKHKLEHRFDLYDKDGDGRIGWADHRRVAADVATVFGHEPGSPAHTAVDQAHRQMWERLCEAAGIQPEGDIDRERFCETVAVLAADEEAYRRNFAPVTAVILAVADTDGNGVLDREEVGRLVAAFGVPPMQAQHVAFELDLNGDGVIDAAELDAAHRDYLTSKNLSSAGNVLFGASAL